jgi:hypothetical protein
VAWLSDFCAVSLIGTRSHIRRCGTDGSHADAVSVSCDTVFRDSAAAAISLRLAAGRCLASVTASAERDPLEGWGFGVMARQAQIDPGGPVRQLDTRECKHGGIGLCAPVNV